ncbi:MAG: metallophosphoesterase [Geminicoccaceae bacterium]
MGNLVELRLPPEFRGLLVVGDIHGHVELMDRMIAHAASERLLFVSCGDIVDRGPDSTGCLLRMRELGRAGQGVWIRGNHEDKLFRALMGRSVRISNPLAATLEELRADERGEQARSWLVEHFETVPYALRLASLFIVHGGFGVRMLDIDPLPPPLRARAIYGQPSRERKSDGKPQRLYRWVNEIPPDMTVLIGHDPCCGDCLLERRGTRGGRAVHIDSAAGKGGPLSAVETDRDGGIVRAVRVRYGTPAVEEIPILPHAPHLVRPSNGGADAEEVAEFSENT